MLESTQLTNITLANSSSLYSLQGSCRSLGQFAFWCGSTLCCNLLVAGPRGKPRLRRRVKRLKQPHPWRRAALSCYLKRLYVFILAVREGTRASGSDSPAIALANGIAADGRQRVLPVNCIVLLHVPQNASLNRCNPFSRQLSSSLT